ncbi:glyoxylate/hydroxypyruvate reductase HPR3-like [Quercus lobata]|uniref:glyoxylate/hydroxypyruvate reductase HPR3-like n=1 Tax=Quercus lobata TaxID=97700 RepID=UPI0012471ECE|nr:glyoxylate/hydroxypyruvate reductase HPR3-like [Quercus lobata]
MATKEEQPQVLENKEEPKEEGELPLVVVLRSKNFNLPLEDHLQSHFHLLDPNDSPDESIESFLSRHAHSTRALLCVGLTPLIADTLGPHPSLELVVGSNAGVEHIDLHECRRHGIMVISASAAFSKDVVDYAMALLIDVLRRISTADHFVQGRLWPVKGEHPLGFKVCF